MNIVELTVRRVSFIIQKYSSNKVESAFSSDVPTDLLKKHNFKKCLAKVGRGYIFPVKHRVTIGSIFCACNNGEEQIFGSVDFDARPAKTVDICDPLIYIRGS